MRQGREGGGHVIAFEWTDVVRFTSVVAAAVTREAWRPDAVVAVARGGLTPAHLIAQRLNIAKVTSVGARFTDRQRTQISIYASPSWPHGKPTQLLLVEDAVDTGRLIRAAAAELPGEIRTAALVAVGVWRPDFVGLVAREIPAMPWEVAGDV